MKKLLISLALSASLCSISYSPKHLVATQAPQLKFVQHNILFDESYSTYNSDWGGCELIFEGSPFALYFNLFVEVDGNADWQIENMPVVSREGEYVLQNTHFNFDLMNEPGTDVKKMHYTYRLTHEMQEEGWWENDELIPADVEDEDYIMNTGIQDNFFQFAPKAEKMEGGKSRTQMR